MPNEVLRRAILLPKDFDTSGARHPCEGERLPKHPITSDEALIKQDEYNRMMGIKPGDDEWIRQQDEYNRFMGIKPKKEEEDGGKKGSGDDMEGLLADAGGAKKKKASKK